MEQNNNLQYKIIALDLDGTLTNDAKEVTPKTREALLNAQQEGVVIVLASGRPTYGIKPVADCLELNQHGGYMLSYNGGQIIDGKSGGVVYSKYLPDDVIPVLYSYARSHGHALLGYVGDEIVTEMPWDEYVKEESRINRMAVRHVDNLLTSIERHPTKLLMPGDPAKMIAAEWTCSAQRRSSSNWCRRASTRRSRCCDCSHASTSLSKTSWRLAMAITTSPC